MNRRIFLEKIARFSLLAAILSVAGILTLRSFNSERCQVASFCADCGKYDDCTLPEKEKHHE